MVPPNVPVADYAMLYCDRRLTWGEDAELAMGQVRDANLPSDGDSPEAVVVEMPHV